MNGPDTPIPPAPPADYAGGQGGAELTRTDLKLIRQAARHRWPVSDAIRAKTVEKLAALLDEDECKRLAVMAARTLGELDRQNMEQEKRESGIPDRLDLTTGGQRLGNFSLDPTAFRDFAADVVAAGLGTLPADGGAKPMDAADPLPQAAALPHAH
jgi:hypothetical protein